MSLLYASIVLYMIFLVEFINYIRTLLVNPLYHVKMYLNRKIPNLYENWNTMSNTKMVFDMKFISQFRSRYS